MLSLHRPDGSCYLMDVHEVTRGAYREFLGDPPQPLGDVCFWNEEFEDAACAVSVEGTADDLPMSCVDQCDAEQYCTWAGKTLCRGDSEAANNPNQDDWHNACTNGGETLLPYGNSPDRERCNLQVTAGAPWEVGAGIQCKNGAGVLDLLGNVWEWVGGQTACSLRRGADDPCTVRGGSFSEEQAECGLFLSPTRNTRRRDIGFRCCAYPDPEP